MIGSETPLGPNPYVGPRPFQTGETIYGRDAEIRDLFYLLNAERIVVLHSPSGAGKTSLVHAGLIPLLKREEFDVWPSIRVNQESPDEETNRYIASAIASLEEGLPEEHRRPDHELRSQRLLEYVARRPRKRSAPQSKVLIFDQFEELLTVDPLAVAAKQDFFDQVGELLINRNVWALFVLREDYLAPFDPYAELVPTQLKNRFRTDLLCLDAAREAIIRPADAAGRVFTDEAAKQLIHDLATMSVQQPDGSTSSQTGHHVEPVQLQVVCRRLWDGMREDDRNIDSKDLKQLGDVNEALAEYYATSIARIAAGDQPSERFIREWAADKLITPAGIRGQVLQGLDESEGLSNETVFALIDAHLVRAERRRGSTWFELAHDRLIEPVTTNNEQWFASNLNELQRRATQWQKQHWPAGLLLSGSELAEATEWAEANESSLTSVESKLLEQSQREERKNLAIRWLAFIAVVVAVVAVSFYFSAKREKRAAETAKEQAIEAKRKAEAKEHELANTLALHYWTLGDGQRDESRLSARHLLAAAHEVAKSPGLKSSILIKSAMPYSRLHTQMRLWDTGEVRILGTAFSNDGSRILTWGRGKDGLDATVRLWDAKTHQQVGKEIKQYGVTAAAFYPDASHFLVVSGFEGNLWDANSGKLVVTMPYSGGFRKPVVFNRDGTLFFAAWGLDAQLWSTKTHAPVGKVMKHPESEPDSFDTITGAAFSGDGSRIMTWSEDGPACLWDAATQTRIGSEIKQRWGFNEALLNEDGSLILTWHNYTVQLWDGATQSLRCEIDLEDPLTSLPIKRVMVTNDSRQVLIAQLETGARLWDLNSKQPIGKEMKHFGLRDAVLTTDGSRLLTWSYASARLWDVKTQTQLGTEMRHRLVAGASFHGDESHVLTWSRDGKARVWDASALVPPERKMIGRSRSCEICSKCNRIFTWGDGGVVQLWDAKTQTPVGAAIDHGPVVAAVFSKDGSRVLTWGAGGAAQLWNTSTQTRDGATMNHELPIVGAVFNNDGRRLLTWDEHGALQLWSANTQTLIRPLSNHDPVVDAVFNNNGSRVSTWGEDGILRIWDPETGVPVGTPMNHAGPVAGAVFNTDDSHLLTYGKGTARLWDISSQTQTAADLKYSMHVGISDTRIVTWADDGLMQLWNVKTQTQLQPEMRHTGVTAVVFGGDAGRRILSWSQEDGVVRMWDTATRRQLGPDMRHHGVKHVRFNDQSNQVLTWSDNGAVRLWDARTQKQIGRDMEHIGIRNAIGSDDGSRIATLDQDEIRLWDTRTQSQIGRGIQSGFVQNLVLNGDGSRVLTWGLDELELWDADTQAQMGPTMYMNGTFSGAIFCGDGSRILTWGRQAIELGNLDSRNTTILHLWDTAAQRLLTPEMNQNGQVYRVVFAEDEAHFLTFCADDTKRLWEVPGDLDYPSDMLRLEVETLTGSEYDLSTQKLRALEHHEWEDKLKRWKARAAEHYGHCKYPRQNVVRNYFPEQAKRIRSEASKTE